MDATFVAFVPKSYCDDLRAALELQYVGDICWTERRNCRGREFYFSGRPLWPGVRIGFLQEWLCGK